MRIMSVCLSVRQSVCLFLKRVICDKMEEISIQIIIPYERSFSLVFREERLVGGQPLLCEVLEATGPPLKRNRGF